MSNVKDVYRKLPEIIKSILITSDGWLVGSSLKDLIDGKPVNDYDIAVPFEQWGFVIPMLRLYPYSLNTYGGFKLNLIDENGNNIELDIWPQDLHKFLKVGSISYLLNLRSRTLLTTGE